MVIKTDNQLVLFKELGIKPFKEKFPWLGGDLQTLRDSFVKDKLLPEIGEIIQIEIPSMPNNDKGAGHLIAFLNRPHKSLQTRGLILILHGLGGSSRRNGLRRMALTFLEAGFAVLRLNLRGADPGRKFASGTYSAKCDSDLKPVLVRAREICGLLSESEKGTKEPLPLFGVGLSLGGTILLNAYFELVHHSIFQNKAVLDGLACISSPLDLVECSAAIERPRNSFYQSWLLRRLIRQTMADPFGILDTERDALIGINKPSLLKVSSIRSFDSAITAPRWGFRDVDEYYQKASPLKELLRNPFDMPNTLFIHSSDDPWVPSAGLRKLSEKIESYKLPLKVQICLSPKGGHNGFHGVDGCWGDEVVKRWLIKLVN